MHKKLQKPQVRRTRSVVCMHMTQLRMNCITYLRRINAEQFWLAALFPFLDVSFLFPCSGDLGDVSAATYCILHGDLKQNTSRLGERALGLGSVRSRLTNEN